MSEAQMINFELVSPEEKLVSEPVQMAVIPGLEGEMGVGKDHASFVVALKAGVVQLFRKEGDEVQKIFIAGGFADVTGQQCVVLAEEAINVTDMDQSALEQELSNLNEDLGLAEEVADKGRIEAAIDLVQAKLNALKA